jgi:hypothetical protein
MAELQEDPVRLVEEAIQRVLAALRWLERNRKKGDPASGRLRMELLECNKLLHSCRGLAANLTSRPLRCTGDELAELLRKAAGLQRRVVVDASNVAHFRQEGAKFRNLELMVRACLERGWFPVLVASAKLKHEIDDVTSYQRLLQARLVREAPWGYDDDLEILRLAAGEGLQAISDDEYKEYRERFPQVGLVGYSISGSEVRLWEKGPLGRVEESLLAEGGERERKEG